MRDTGFSAVTTAAIKARSGNVCEVQVDPVLLAELFSGAPDQDLRRWSRFGGCMGEAIHKHHRRNRAAGSSRDPVTNAVSSGLHVCLTCHQFIGAEPQLSYSMGWLVHQLNNPADVWVFYRGERVLLSDDGGLVAA